MEQQQQLPCDSKQQEKEVGAGRDFNLREWGLRARMISRENTISRRFSASNISRFREDNKSFRSNFTISSTASSPGYPLGGSLPLRLSHSFHGFMWTIYVMWSAEILLSSFLLHRCDWSINILIHNCSSRYELLHSIHVRMIKTFSLWYFDIICMDKLPKEYSGVGSRMDLTMFQISITFAAWDLGL